jgi:hypothetical protein
MKNNLKYNPLFCELYLAVSLLNRGFLFKNNLMKITLTEKTETTREIELTLPYYSKAPLDLFYYKVVSENYMVKLTHCSNDYCIETTKYTITSAFYDDRIVITEEEFNNKFNELLTLINSAK